MSLGVVILVHNALGRATEVIRHWAQSGCPVVVHVDSAMRRARFERFRAGFDDLARVELHAREIIIGKG